MTESTVCRHLHDETRFSEQMGGGEDENASLAGWQKVICIQIRVQWVDLCTSWKSKLKANSRCKTLVTGESIAGNKSMMQLSKSWQRLISNVRCMLLNISNTIRDTLHWSDFFILTIFYVFRTPPEILLEMRRKNSLKVSALNIKYFHLTWEDFPSKIHVKILLLFQNSITQQYFMLLYCYWFQFSKKQIFCKGVLNGLSATYTEEVVCKFHFLQKIL